MNRHAGSSFALSVLIVGFFAVVLYQPETPHQAPSPGRSTSKPGPSNASAGPPLTPGVPLIEATADVIAQGEGPPNAATLASQPHLGPGPPQRPSSDDPGSVSSAAEPPYAARRGAEATAIPSTTGSAPPIHTASRRRPSVPTPRPAFTLVSEGESLTDVAIRIYGTPDAVRNLWMANRDLIENQDAALRSGTLLRTP